MCCTISATNCPAVEAETSTEIPPTIIETTELPTANTDAIMNTLVKANPSWDEGCSDTALEISQEDAQMLMRIASAEAQNQGEYGMYLVMRVVMNRVNDKSGMFPSTVAGVIFQPGQFETVSNGTYYTININAEAHTALALLEKNMDADKTIIAFETISNGKALEKYFDVAYVKGNHIFYTEKRQ